ncbi:peptide chain release factor N(5)-glutamine methyltransferase [Bartonella apihabitans]|uniref:peptide chain release factor N(5)-glutamine methyltransferase n=1 Tax=uncultured Bartonella sp. TaxID=104108 RepID=UPI0027418EA6|nr:peptide chain release factor N(5)-glutamine methyltransferase [Bartonella apihabitans]
MASLSDVLKNTRKLFRNRKLDNADLDARLLVEFVTSTTRTDEILNPDLQVSDEALQRLDKAIHDRLNGKPVYRIIGKREFYGIEFQLSADTLEPRDDTETLVDLVLPEIQAIIGQYGEAGIVDMGTGTGAIAIALLANVDRLKATAVDISDNALETALLNAKNASVADRFTPLNSDWFSYLSGKFDMIISNPPYIPENQIPSLATEVKKYDPLKALSGGEDGLQFYRKLAKGGRPFLKQHGMIAVEIGQGQEEDVIALFSESGFKLKKTRKDLNGILRALLFS